MAIHPSQHRLILASRESDETMGLARLRAAT
jgi:hypothetical protein